MHARRWTAGAILAAAAGTAVLGAAAAAAPPEEKAAKTRVEDLAWLAGTWRSEDDHGLFEEHWLPPASGGMAGVFRAVTGGKTSLYEVLAIEAGSDGTPVMLLRHFGPGLEPWKSEAGKAPSWPLAESGKGKAVFTNPEITFPRSLSYALEGKDTVVVRLDADPSSGKHPMEFRLGRVK